MVTGSGLQNYTNIICNPWCCSGCACAWASFAFACVKYFSGFNLKSVEPRFRIGTDSEIIYLSAFVALEVPMVSDVGVVTYLRSVYRQCLYQTAWYKKLYGIVYRGSWKSRYFGMNLPIYVVNGGVGFCTSELIIYHNPDDWRLYVVVQKNGRAVHSATFFRL